MVCLTAEKLTVASEMEGGIVGSNSVEKGYGKNGYMDCCIFVIHIVI
jgi:hypothetical protein